MKRMWLSIAPLISVGTFGHDLSACNAQAGEEFGEKGILGQPPRGSLYEKIVRIIQSAQ